jgi:large conductance mechanosensitive channel
MPQNACPAGTGGLSIRISAFQKEDDMLKEFREFAMKGNMVDLAIGVIIGAAFGALVSSLVQDIFTPIIGWILGGTDFSNLFIQLAGEQQDTLAAAQEAGATIAYGNFINVLISFLITAWILFLIVKGMNRLRRRQEEAPAEEPKAPPQEVLLSEIRDLLKAQAK